MWLGMAKWRLPPNPISELPERVFSYQFYFGSMTKSQNEKKKFWRAIFRILWLSALLEFNPHLAIPSHKCLSCLMAHFLEAVMDPREFLWTLTRRLYRKFRFIQIDFSETWQQAKGKDVVYRKEAKKIQLYVHIHVNENRSLPKNCWNLQQSKPKDPPKKKK